MGARRFAILFAGLAALAPGGCVTGGFTPSAETPAAAGPAKPGAAVANRELLLIPSPARGTDMHAYFYRPAGAGPYPLAVINHGSDEDARKRAQLPMPSFDSLTEWFLAHGYAVLLPQRPGHGETGGPYIEAQGSCEAPDYVKSGNRTADSIAAAVDFMAAKPFIRKTGIIVVGNSAGGWGALAYAARNPKNVAAVIAFAAGRGGRNHNRAGWNCAPDRLVAAAGAFGATARMPTLWLYAANDSYFAPDLSRRMADAWRAAGGKAEYDLLPATSGDGHFVIQTDGPEATWEPYVAKFVAMHPR
ncbi:MAG TPA: alpha/beta fold hydrolase [Bauldia sp.]|nr:alpha/beta fold hydrolase [Bauldia sp.]